MLLILILTRVQTLQTTPEARIAVAVRSRERLCVAQAALAFAGRQNVWAQIVLATALVLVGVPADVTVLAGNASWCGRTGKHVCSIINSSPNSFDI